MTKGIAIADDLTLPIEAASQLVGLVGIRNSGKTNTAGVFAECLLDQHQQLVVLDPTDAWWGLRSGYQVFIFGGEHGDTDLAGSDGRVMADFVVRERVPAIFSLRHLRKKWQREFVADFCEEIYHLKGRAAHRTPMTIIIDEAPLFAPQRVSPETARVLGAVEDLGARGRNTGFGVMLIGQRPATMHKDVLSQCDTIISHRLIGPHDRRAFRDWLEDNAADEKQREVLSSLPMLKQGEAWVWAPSLDIMQQVQIRKRRTFDSSSSPTRKRSARVPKTLEQVDLEKLKAKLADVVERTQAEDPRRLRKRIDDLQGTIEARDAEIVALKAHPPLVMDVKGIRDLAASIRSLQDEIRDLNVQAQQATDHGKLVSRMAVELGEQCGALCTGTPPPAATVVPASDSTPVPVAGRGPWNFPVQVEGADLDRPHRTFLAVLATLSRPASKTEIAIVARYSPSSRHVDNVLSAMSRAGHVTRKHGLIEITDAGRAALGAFEPATAGRALLADWIGKVNKPKGAMLRVLADVYPETLTREALAQRAGYSVTSRHVDNTISSLRSQRLIHGTRDALQCAPEFFVRV